VIGMLFQETKEQNAREFIREVALVSSNLCDPQPNAAINYGVVSICEAVLTHTSMGHSIHRPGWSIS